jgi:glycosyltransferase involved in cell wall biosynthesis
MQSSNSMNSINKKKITVLIVSSNRKIYLQRAIESVIRQNFPKNLVEVIVVKPFLDRNLDSLIEKEGMFQIIVGEEASVGYMLAKGIEASNGEIICFLDDDDAFLTNKLSMVAEAFEVEELTYYHNSHSRLRDNGKIAINPLYNSHRLTRPFLGDFSSLDDITYTLQKLNVFNLSSISVKRDALISSIEEIRQIRGCTDYMMYYVSMKFGGKFFIGDEITSIYYIHNNSAMRPSGGTQLYCKHLLALAEQQIEVHEFGSKVLSCRVGHEDGLITGFIYQWKFLKSISENVSKKLLLENFMPFFKSALVNRRRYVLVFSVIFVISLLNNCFAINSMFSFSR